MKNRVFILGVMLCFSLMILSLLGSCSLHKKAAKAEAEEIINCVVVAKQWDGDNCWVWLKCGTETRKLLDCVLIDQVNKMDVLQLKR